MSVDAYEMKKSCMIGIYTRISFMNTKNIFRIYYISFLWGLYSERTISKHTFECFNRNVDSLIFWNLIATESDDTGCPPSKFTFNLQLIRMNIESVLGHRWRFFLQIQLRQRSDQVEVTLKFLFTTEFVDVIVVAAFAVRMPSAMISVGKSKNKG